MLLLNKTIVDFTPIKVRSTISHSTTVIRGKKYTLEYNHIDRQFYVTVDNIKYEVILENIQYTEYLFSTPDNDVYPSWTIKKSFKKRLFNNNNTIYWRAFYNNMILKGIIKDNHFIVNYDYYIALCNTLYDKYCDKQLKGKL